MAQHTDAQLLAGVAKAIEHGSMTVWQGQTFERSLITGELVATELTAEQYAASTGYCPSRHSSNYVCEHCA